MDCEVCGDPCAKRCSKCHTVAYCSTDCQRDDWNRHKKVCKTPRTVQQVLKEWRHVPNFAAEYRSQYPHEHSHHAFLEDREETLKKEVDSGLKIDLKSLKKEDLKEIAARRWGNAFRSSTTPKDERKLNKFICKPTAFFGNILDFTPAPEVSSGTNKNQGKKVHQIFRNCAGHPLVYEFGYTYVSLGFVDLWQVMDGTYLNVDTAVLKFYGFDGNELAVARSLVVLEMMKAPFEEICNKTILQVWFSSCWDAQTKDQFTSFLEKHLSCHSSVNNPLLKKYAKIWLKKMPHLSVMDAHAKFTKNYRFNFFNPVLSLKRENDRVKFLRYLLTGCLFVDEAKAVCGNPTIFPCGSDDGWIRQYGTVFDFINLNRIIHNAESLIDNILNNVKYKLMSFRTLVQNDKVECFLEAKAVDTDDDAFAERLKGLNAYTMTWSNLPDYMNRHDFLDFAKKCSGTRTLHMFQLMNWVDHVFGARWIDWQTTENQKILDSLCAEITSSVEPNVLVNAEVSAPSAVKVPLFDRIDVAIDNHLALKYAQKYFDFFLSEGQLFNSAVFAKMQDLDHLFASNPHTIFGGFTFNTNLQVAKISGDNDFHFI